MTLAAQQSMHEPNARARPRRAEAVIVSDDDTFLIEIGPVLGERYRTHPVDHFSGVGAHGERCLVIVDAASVKDARAGVARIEHQHRNTPIIVIAPPQDAQWQAALGRGGVIDVIGREQLGSVRLTEALAKADERLRERADEPAPPRAKPLPRALWIALALLVALPAIWLLVRAPRRPQPAPPPPPARAATATAAAVAVTPAQPVPVLELLSQARATFRDPKTQLPRADAELHGDSALELYAEALAQEPDNDEALDGVQRLLSVAHARIQADVGANKLDDAIRLLALFKATGVAPDSVRELETEVSGARPKWLATKVRDSVAAGDLSGAQQQLGELAAFGGDRASVGELQRLIDAHKLDGELSGLASGLKSAIEAGTLLEPLSDNARTRLQAMRELNRSSPITLSAQRDLQAALLARVQEALRRQQFDGAQRYLGAAAELGPTPEVQEAKRQLQSAIDQSGQHAAPSAAPPPGALPKPAPAAAAIAATAAPALSAPLFIAARPAQPLKVQYPTFAADQNMRGTVTLEFTLQADGRASDISVIEAQPRRIFDSAAISAVAGGRFDTGALDKGQPRRARIKLVFRPS